MADRMPDPLSEAASTLTRLEAVLADLAVAGTDHQTVEAKRAGRGLPDGIAATLSAFANTAGGLLLLGVDEQASGEFNVTGVVDPAKVSAALQSAAELMMPPLRLVIEVVAHPDGTVVVAQVPAVPSDQRPCHVASDGPHASSFIRVGDGDQRLSAAEVSALLAGRTHRDSGTAPAPDGATVDSAAVAEFAATVRESSSGHEEASDEEILRHLGAVTNDGSNRLTFAGLLTLGDNPAAFSASARISYMRLPRSTDPEGTRHAAQHLEGTIGQLLDKSLAALSQDLEHVQMVRDGQVFDELDVPREALREILSNALVHRSFVNGARNESISIQISDTEVVVTSPGGISPGADPTTLGLQPIAALRNLSLVRIAEKLRTPSGARIVEHQAAGIAHADRVCHRQGTMPALFLDLPTSFIAVLIRRSIDLEEAHQLLDGDDWGDDEPALRRMLSVLLQLERERAAASSKLGPAIFDARFCARCLAPCTPEDASVYLGKLERSGVLRRSNLRLSLSWTLAQTASLPTSSRSSGSLEDRIVDLLNGIAAGPPEGVNATALQEAMGLASASTRHLWISRALDKGLIRRTKENPYDRTNTFVLTESGMAQLGQATKKRPVNGS